MLLLIGYLLVEHAQALFCYASVFWPFAYRFVFAIFRHGIVSLPNNVIFSVKFYSICMDTGQCASHRSIDSPLHN